MQNIIEKAKDIVSDALVWGEDKDIDKAKELIGSNATLYAAIRPPESAYKLETSDHCKYCWVPCIYCPMLNLSKKLEHSLYIVSDEGVKVHTDPYDPPCPIVGPSKDTEDFSLDKITDIEVFNRDATCCAPSAVGVTLKGLDVDIYVSEPEKFTGIFKKVQTAAEAVKSAADKSGEATSET